VSLGAAPLAVANWMTQDLAGLLNKARIELEASRIRPRHLADLVRLVGDGTISSAGAKQALEDAFESGDAIDDVVERRGLRQVTDSSALRAWIDEAIAENPGPVEQFRGGKDAILGFLVGQVMRKSGGSANPLVLSDLLRERLSET
jgi:aspartyl-tRNA(Asn)/glutamyl-tRNA(Gln) amidotransferase subunit B